jgi:hypothetical protein
MSVLSYLDRILTELRQFLELGTVTTHHCAGCDFKHSRIPRTISYCAAGCGGCAGLGETWTAFGAGGAKAKIF